ncbi:phage portal protein [Streptococcus suis]|nr:phage portal protein [Streptococcus suis]
MAQMTDKELQSILDHPKISLSKDEVDRIREDFTIYAGKHPQVEYLNSIREKKKRDFQGLNMTKVASEYMANIVFNEQCEINISDKHAEAKEFINKVLEDNKFIKNLSTYLEPMFATGGLAVRPYVDNGRIEFSWCLADTFYPLKSNTNAISECVIASRSINVENDKEIFYTLLEFHEWQGNDYVITNELYRSERKEVVGRRVSVNMLYADLPERVVFNSAVAPLNQPLFSYLKPVGFNNISPRSPLGLSLVDNAKSTIKRIDEVSDQFFWEIKKGKRRVITSEHFVNTSIDPVSGRPIQYFDEDEDMFLALPSAIDDMQWKDITPEIRSQQYIASLNNFLATLEMQIKVSPGTFYFDGAGVKTATEVISEDSLTFRTRSANVNAVSEFIKDVLISVFELASRTIGPDGKLLYAGEIPAKRDIGIDFDDGIFTDKKSQLDYYAQAQSAGLIPKTIVIQRLFDVDEATAKEWLELMVAENNSSNPLIKQISAEQSLLGGDE